MAGGSRTLKLSILGDVSDLNKSLKTANTDVEGFGNQVSDFGKKAGAAFAVAGAAAAAYAGKLLIDGVKSAIEDEAAQAKLATTLENVTGATQGQIKATEDYILKTELAFGITDNELRPSLERLVRATKNSEEAQKLQTLAIDVAAGSGKSLETVSNALGKAYEGNTGALVKLGIGLSTTDAKAMSLDEITKTLSDTFGGQATEKANTFAGKMDILKVSLDEAKESVGAALLPEITKLIDYIVINVVPQINAFVLGLTGDKGAKNALDKTGQASFDLGTAFRDAAVSVGKLFGVFNNSDNTGENSGLAKVIGWLTAIVTTIGNVVSAIATMIKSLQTFSAWIGVATNPRNWLKGVSGMKAMVDAELAKLGYGAVVSGAVNSSEIMNIQRAGQVARGAAQDVLTTSMVSGGTTGSTATGGGVSSTTQAALDNVAALQAQVDLQIAAGNAQLNVVNDLSRIADLALPKTPYDPLSSFVQPTTNINLTVNGAIDPMGAARAIYTALGMEATTSGTFNNIGGSRLVAL
ncbi:hypothetical protein UFOVP1662_23 [uncultured Caudovirales phage]|uniref:Uncharacterized protein n=3 Tax=uncultured Caudovirales phage TaxID=2100421 RepID=A0A6J5Q5U4_9CAUD|nr:hypothetical protein UFOVP1050_4 [uncultured Caudovirales phage]CAB4181091.1 hypothetical protein UFOVP1059_16 [uncultured Caudovirales phage]CAB4194901.1 hypothetical protein UFOVP1274_11 [uncultured Caudovirales phage]CAB4222935.1 hypothetical protein UFOVP1662_23 [uncultured Caudovirales phage]